MNRTEYSLSLDSVICRRCNTISRAEEDTCPFCGADRQGAIFTSAAEAAATAAAAAGPAPEQLDIVDLRDSNWLKRVVRRKMVTSYPSLAEPGDEPRAAPPRKPARTGIAMLVGGVVAGLAAGGYWYVHSDDEADPATARPVISVAGAIHNGASDPGDASDTRHASLARSQTDSPSTHAATPASPATAKSSRSPRDEQKSEAPQALAHAATSASNVAPQVANASRPAAPSAPVATRAATDAAPTASRTEQLASTPPRMAAATAPARPPMQAAPPAATIAATPASHVAAPAAAKSVAPGVATGAIASTSGTVVPAAPSARPTTPPPATTTAAAPTPKPESRENATSSVANANKPTAPDTGASPNIPRPATLAATTPPRAPAAAKPATQPSEPARSTTSTLASNAPATTPQSAAVRDKPAAAPTIAAHPPAPASQRTAIKDKPAPATTIASVEKPPAPPAQEPLPPSVARNIIAVQQSLAGRDLSSARRHMRGLYASQPRSPEIQQLAVELSRQERARDSAIANARSCSANKEPACALRNARRAVSLDPRNAQAQAALRHALVVQNESNTEYFEQASAIPRRALPAMTFDGRWSVSGRHAAVSSEQGNPSHITIFGWGVPTVSKGRGDAH